MDIVILTHAVAGTLALGLAAIALRSPKRRGGHTRAGGAYVPVMAFLLVGGAVIGGRDPALSPFEIAIVPTAGPLLVGYAAVRLRPRRWLGRPWLPWHIGGMGGSVIGLVTAGLFQTVGRVAPDDPLATALLFGAPSAVGTVLIVRAIERRLPPAAPAGA